MDLPIDGMTKTPFGWPLMAPFFVASLNWAIGEPDIQKRFREETGHNLDVLIGRSPIDRMIDNATGHQKAVIVAFADWVVVNIWGEEDANETATPKSGGRA